MDTDYRVVVIDQTGKGLRSDLVRAWFPEGERPTPAVSGVWESIKPLCGVTMDGETMFLDCESNFNSEVTIHRLQALQEKFGEKICVILDNAPYFASNKVQEFAEDTPIELCYLPRSLAPVNPVEE